MKRNQAIVISAIKRATAKTMITSIMKPKSPNNISITPLKDLLVQNFSFYLGQEIFYHKKQYSQKPNYNFRRSSVKMVSN